MIFYGFFMLLPLLVVLFLLYVFMSKQSDHPKMSGSAGIHQRRRQPRAHGREV
ncbi:hypothetical protein AB4Y89_12700 [Terriglobus sp. 2YAB30_2]|uniref:hypothetical protein n=1 Tax=unclassified Terriglobus TaxID=2628988 RepID=UPI003F9C9771